jgi:peptidoglycan hydrolase CwlO-like protein
VQIGRDHLQEVHALNTALRKVQKKVKSMLDQAREAEQTARERVQVFNEEDQHYKELNLRIRRFSEEMKQIEVEQ